MTADLFNFHYLLCPTDLINYDYICFSVSSPINVHGKLTETLLKRWCKHMGGFSEPANQFSMEETTCTREIRYGILTKNMLCFKISGPKNTFFIVIILSQKSYHNAVILFLLIIFFPFLASNRKWYRRIRSDSARRGSGPSISCRHQVGGAGSPQWKY